jgi:hypothetical protein
MPSAEEHQNVGHPARDLVRDQKAPIHHHHMLVSGPDAKRPSKPTGSQHASLVSKSCSLSIT